MVAPAARKTFPITGFSALPARRRPPAQPLTGACLRAARNRFDRKPGAPVCL